MERPGAVGAVAGSGLRNGGFGHGQNAPQGAGRSGRVQGSYPGQQELDQGLGRPGPAPQREDVGISDFVVHLDDTS